MINGSSKLDPAVLGTQYPGAIPCGKKIPAKRVFGFEAVALSGVCAGSMASRKGNDNVTPAPRRNVRRERCFLEINIFIKPPSALCGGGHRPPLRFQA